MTIAEFLETAKVSWPSDKYNIEVIGFTGKVLISRRTDGEHIVEYNGFKF
jgi:hypothetical protein